MLRGDDVYGGWTDVGDCPAPLLDRLMHYFLSYKSMPGGEAREVEIASVYGRDEAAEVIRLAQADYAEGFGGAG